MRMEPEAIQRWAEANRAYLALENGVAAIFAAEAGEAERTVELRWENPMLTVKGDVDRVTRARMRAAWMAWGVEPSEWVPWTRLIDEAFGPGTWEEGTPR